MSVSNNIVHWAGHNCFEVDVSPQMHRSKINRIIGYDDGFLTIEFMDRSWVTIYYPSNLANLAKEIETGLLQYKGWKKETLSAIRIKKIMNCLIDYLEKIKHAIRTQNTNRNITKYALKSTTRSNTLYLLH